MALTGAMDCAVKDYLLYRGLHGSLKLMENEVKNEKEKGFRVDKIMDMLHNYVTSCDLVGLRDYWLFLDRRLFSRLEQAQAGSVRKLEVSLLKFYLVNLVQMSKADKIAEFFEKMAPEIQSQPEWRDWFILPFVKSPEENTAFAMYFTKQWQDTFFLSLHNFLAIVIQAMPAPSVLNQDETLRQLAKLREENQHYRQKLTQLMEKGAEGLTLSDLELVVKDKTSSSLGASTMDLMDDFFVISQDTTIHTSDSKPQTAPPPKSQQIKSFIRNIGLPASPIMGHRNAPSTSTPSATTTTATTSAASKNSVSQAPQSASVKRDDSKNKAKSSATNNSSGNVVSSYVQNVEASELAKYSRISSSSLNMDGFSEADRLLESVVPDRVKHGEADQPDGTGAYMLLSQEEYSEHHSAITQCRFSPSGQCVATCDVDGVVKVWSQQPSPVTMATTMSRSTLTAIEWASKADRLLLLGSKAGTIRLFDIKEKKAVKEASTDPAFPRIVSLSCNPSGTSFVCSASGRSRPAGGAADSSSGGSTGTARSGKLFLWDLKTMKMERQLPITPNPVTVNWTSFNHNGQLLLTAASDGNIRIFDLRQGDCIGQWAAHQGELYTVAFSSDETSCYSMGSDSKFCQWSIHQVGRKLHNLNVHQGACGPFMLTGAGGYRQVQTPRGKLFAFDTEGHHVLTCGQNGGIVYELSDGVLRHPLTLGGHRTPVVSVDWSSAVDCKICVTGAMDGKVRVSTLLAH